MAKAKPEATTSPRSGIKPRALSRSTKRKARTKPTQKEVLYAYVEWLHFEMNAAVLEMNGGDPQAPVWVPCNCVKFEPHFRRYKTNLPSKRAATVLKAVGATVRLDSPFSPERVAEADEARRVA